ncbi:MAG: hypothetical protein M3O91_08760 [Chloroflexota bacterium]|nr:hypothetical protein [Chloroflexota bacterium]
MVALHAVMTELAQALAGDAALALLSTAFLVVTAAAIVHDARSRYEALLPRAVPLDRGERGE